MKANQAAKSRDRSRIERLAKSIVLATAMAAIWLLASEAGAQQSAVIKGPVFVYDEYGAGRLGELFRVEVYGNGEVVYFGRANVKTMGEIRFTVEPERVKEFERALQRIEFNSFQPAPFQPDWLGRRIFVSLEEPMGSRSFTFNNMTEKADQHFYVRLFDLVEEYFPTENLRCPYVIPESSPFKGVDVCAGRASVFEQFRSQSPQ